MIDRAKIHVKAGKGGNGCTSFIGKKFTRSRACNGGDGGRGGSVIIRVDSNIQTLEHFQYKKNFHAENGKCGQANKKRGAAAGPCIVRVPPGTNVRDLQNDFLLRDLQTPGEELIAAKGGEGGKGNTKARSATPGLPGEERTLLLELKLIADVGIIGYPNTGKSSLLARLSSAQPKIASYPFTTTVPFLGVLKFTDFAEPGQLVIIELPALTKGSHEGRGLGTQFLRHAERARLLIHLVDMSSQKERDAFDDLQQVNRQLELYSKELAAKPQVIAANKMDLPEAQANFKRFSAQLNKRIFPISALHGQGIEELTAHLREYFK